MVLRTKSRGSKVKREIRKRQTGWVGSSDFENGKGNTLLKQYLTSYSVRKQNSYTNNIQYKMQLRYTTKVYLFNKAIHKTLLSKPEFQMLYTVYINDGRRITDISNTLRWVNRETGDNYTIKYLKQLIYKGYIIRKGFKYTITPTVALTP